MNPDTSSKGLHLTLISALGVLSVLVFLWLMGSVPPSDASVAIAATPTPSFVVNTPDDEADGECFVDCSLRDAIILANGNGQEDWILLSPDTYVLSLTGPDEDAAATGDLDITAPVTISGGSPDWAFIDANGIDRVFDVRPGAGQVIFSGVTVQGGWLSLEEGGGILSADADLILANTVVNSNQATRGGGVYIRDGHLTLDDSQILSNTAEYGGGVHVGGSSPSHPSTLVMTGNSTIALNDATSGAGLFVNGGSVELYEGQIISNTAADQGGGVYVSQATFTQTGSSTVLNNSAGSEGGGVFVAGNAVFEGGEISDNSAQSGGGVYVAPGSAAFNDIQIYDNTATWGGGLYVASGSATLGAGPTLGNAANVDGPVIASNDAMHGGGVYVDTGTMTMNGGEISHNDANFGGGLKIDTGEVTLANARIVSNTALISGGWGGGVYLRNGLLTLDSGSQINHNSADRDGGGVFIGQPLGGEGGQLLQTGNSTIAHNSATLGAGLFVNSGSAVLNEGQIISNTATDQGGGVYVSQATFTQTGSSTVLNNSAGSEGGGVFVAGNAVFEGGEISDNSAQSGGGVYVAPGSAAFNDIQIYDNTATWGGGLYVASGSATLGAGPILGNAANVDGPVIASNDAMHGGGVYVDSGTMTMNGGEISRNTGCFGVGLGINTAQVTLTGALVGNNLSVGCLYAKGGGVYIGNGHLMLDGSRILSNTANYGGGVHVGESHSSHASTLIMTGNNTVAHNSARSGAGLFVNDGSAILNEAQIISNTATHQGGGVYVSQATFTLTGTGAIFYNFAGSEGGGVYVAGQAMFGGVEISDNSAQSGGGVYVGPGSASFKNVDMDGNSASTWGGGLYVASGSATLLGGRILGNTANTDGGGLHLEWPGGKIDMLGGCIVNNSDTGVLSPNAGDLSATYVWWGTPSGPSGQGPGTGDSVGPNVTYAPFNHTANGCPWRYRWTIYLPMVLKDHSPSP